MKKMKRKKDNVDTNEKPNYQSRTNLMNAIFDVFFFSKIANLLLLLKLICINHFFNYVNYPDIINNGIYFTVVC